MSAALRTLNIRLRIEQRIDRRLSGHHVPFARVERPRERCLRGRGIAALVRLFSPENGASARSSARL